MTSNRRRRWRRATDRLFALVMVTMTGIIGAVTVAVAMAGSAAAHSSEISTSPAAGERVEVSPTKLSVSFDDPIEVALGSIRLYDAQGNAVLVGAAIHPDGDANSVEVLVPELSQGGYVVAWRVVSADGHPVQGAFTFRVGDGGGDASPDLIERLLSRSGASTGVGIVFAVVRWIGYAAIASVLGGLGMLTVCLGAWRVPRRYAAVVWVSWALAVVVSVISLGLQGASAIGGGLSDVFRLSLWSDVLSTDFGQAIVARLVGLGVVAWCIGFICQRSRILWRAGAVVGSVLVAVGMGLGGHAARGDKPAIGVGADAVHVLAMSTWFGGLAMLAMFLRSDRQVLACAIPTPEARLDHQAVLVRWSRLATWAVVALIASGVTGAARQLGRLGSLFDSDYGRTLSIKIAIVVGALVVAARARNMVMAKSSTAMGEDARNVVGSAVGRMVAVEVAMLCLVFAATSILVEAVPPRVERGQPVSLSMIQSDVTLQVLVDPARAGDNVTHLYFSSSAGVLGAVSDAELRMTLSERDLGPIDVPMDIAGPNHYSSGQFEIPFSGAWTFEVTARAGTKIVRYSAVVNVR